MALRWILQVFALIDDEKSQETCVEKQGKKGGIGSNRGIIFYLNADPFVLRYEKLILELGDERSDKQSQRCERKNDPQG